MGVPHPKLKKSLKPKFRNYLSLQKILLLMKYWQLQLIVRIGVAAAIALCFLPVEAVSKSFDSVPVVGMVTMIDLGAKKCIPCKMMAPILEKMEQRYRDRAAIVFIDVWEHPEQAKRFRIRAIPTQIFFDENGREIYRHVGFMGEPDIVKQMKQMGVD